MAMKDKKPGDHIILRLKNNESPLILDWINSQSNLSDAIRFLVEEEIKAHAVRDLQEYIPAKRKPLEAAVETAAASEPAATVPEQSAGQPDPAPVQKPSSEDPEINIEQEQVHVESEEESGSRAGTEPKTTAESEPNQEPEAQEEETEDEYSDEIIDHWMNI